jgi:hypothetical protein
MTCARCGSEAHTAPHCTWPTDTDDEPIKVPYVPPVHEDDELDEWM